MEETQRKPKMESNIVMLVGLVLILSLIVTLLVFCRENIFQCRARVHDGKIPIPVKRREPVMQSEEMPTKEGEHQGKVNVKTPDGSGTSLQFLYHERNIKEDKRRRKWSRSLGITIM